MVLSCAGCWTGGTAAVPPARPPQATVRAPPARPPRPAGAAKVVQRSKNGGVLELRGERSAAMANAEEEMTTHCGPASFTITQEGEEVSGDGVAITTAWRIHYVCASTP